MLKGGPAPMGAGDNGAGQGAEGPSRAEATRANEEWRLLHELIVGAESARLTRLESEPREPDAKDLATVLPEAVTRAVGEGPALATSLEATIEAGLEASARKNPAALAEAIYPALGPAIRRMIQALLSDALQGFNSAMENTLSPAGIRWRLEAWRTGRPFREVVLMHSLEWRVQQVFLIHKRTGLLLQDASILEDSGTDPELVSGMLTAIQDFVRDSFAQGDDGDLEQVELSGYRLLIAQGPVAVLAAVVSGSPPPELHVELEELLLKLHVDHARKLEEFEGDTMPFVVVQPALEGCLREQLKVRSRSSLGPIVLVAGVVACALLVGRWWLLERESNRGASAVVELVRAEPGLLLLDWERDGSELRLSGLADPLARSVDALTETAGIKGRLQLHENWQPFMATDPAMVLRRATQALEPPVEVELHIEQGVLVATGKAGATWVSRAHKTAQWLTGHPLDDTGLRNLDAIKTRSLVSALDGRILPFASSSIGLDVDDPDVAAGLRDLVDLDASAAVAGRSVRVELLGLVSEEEVDAPELGAKRAAAVWAALHAKPLGAILVVAAPTDPAGPRTAAVSGVRLSVRLLPVAGDPR